jgi:cyclin L
VKDVSAASIYLVSKLSAYPKSPRSIINAYSYIESLDTVFIDKATLEKNDPESYYVSEGTYYSLRTRLVNTESIILRLLGFQIHVALPYTLCVNYLQALGVFNDTSTKDLAQRAYAHLNSALFSPQLLYLTHQPPALATAAIYLAAREVGVKLPGEQWWEVFDTDREELGFLVVALISMEGFVEEEKRKWVGNGLPLTLERLESEITQRMGSNGSR